MAPNQVYINTGTGHFEDESSTRGFQDSGECRGVAVFDYNVRCGAVSVPLHAVDVIF